MGFSKKFKKATGLDKVKDKIKKARKKLKKFDIKDILDPSKEVKNILGEFDEDSMSAILADIVPGADLDGILEKISSQGAGFAKEPVEDILNRVDIEDLSGDPEDLLDFGTDFLEGSIDATQNQFGFMDVANFEDFVKEVREEEDLSIGDLLNPVEVLGLSDEIKAEIEGQLGDKEDFQDLFGNDLGSYLYETLDTGGILIPHSEGDFQHGGNEELFGEDGDIIDINKEIEDLTGIGGGDGDSVTERAAESQIDFSRKALDLLRSDLQPFKDILSPDQLRDLSSLATDEVSQINFLQDNAFLDTIREKVKESSFRPDSQSNRARSTLGSMGSGTAIGSDRTLGSTVSGFPSVDTNFGISTDDIISRVFLDAGNDLINQQINRQLPLLSTGQSSAAQVGTGSSNLLTGAGNAAAAGTIGAANARAQGAQNTASLIALLASFSDIRLKNNIKKIGEFGDLNIYSWSWNSNAQELGLTGSDWGHVAQEVQSLYPDLVTEKDGYLMVEYGTDRTVSKDG